MDAGHCFCMHLSGLCNLASKHTHDGDDGEHAEAWHMLLHCGIQVAHKTLFIRLSLLEGRPP